MIKSITKGISTKLLPLSVIFLGLLIVSPVLADIPPIIKVGPDGRFIIEPKPRIYRVDSFFSRFYIIVLLSTLLTILSELPVLYLFGFRSRKAVGIISIVNMITLPAFHFMNYMQYGQLASGLGLLMAELCVVSFESLFFIIFLRREISIKKIVIATLAANTVSVLLGKIFYSFLGFVTY